MLANLYINYYKDSHEDRAHEIDSCVKANIALEELDKVFIFVDEKDLEHARLFKTDKVTIYKVDRRPLYNDYFRMSREHPNDINIISNTDIIMDASGIHLMKRYRWGRKCMALSRWDLIEGLDTSKIKHYNHRDSQDTWAVKGGFPDIPQADFTLGKKGCDNRIAFLLAQKYEVINPSNVIKTYHYHLTGIRNYAPHGVGKDLVAPPYKLLNCTRL